MSDTSLREELQEIRLLVESNIQQHSSSHSDLLHRMDVLEKSIQPIVNAFNESRQTRIVIDKFGKASFRFGGWLTAVAGGLFVIWEVVKFIIKQIR